MTRHKHDATKTTAGAGPDHAASIAAFSAACILNDDDTVVYVSDKNERTLSNFERYLKSGSNLFPGD